MLYFGIISIRHGLGVGFWKYDNLEQLSTFFQFYYFPNIDNICFLGLYERKSVILFEIKSKLQLIKLQIK